jgi:hypothetical protein
VANIEDQFIADEISEMLKHHNAALERLKRFGEAYPYLVAPNILEMIEHNLKDNITLLYREFQGVQGEKEKKYDDKFVCKMCHEVFLSSLPDGICDKCRSKTA